MMEINPLQQYMRMETLNGKPSYVATSGASQSFASLLNQVVYQQPIAVQANAQSNKSLFRERKMIVENGDAMEPEDEDNESIYKTVRKIETKIIKLARLERQMMAGF